MIEKEQEIWQIISTVLSGSGTEEEKARFNQWINKQEENKRIFEAFVNIGFKNDEPTDKIKNTVYLKVQKEIIAEKYQRKLRIFKLGNIASIAIILAIGASLIMKPNFSRESPNVEISCPTGTTSKLTLDDGTLVHLNSRSSLTYPVKFAGDTRKVTIKGEAYFEVAKNAKVPFIVESGDIRIKVFGTRFNVKNYETDTTVETSLVEGSVGVYMKSDVNFENKTLVKPNEQIVYNKQTRRLKLRKVDAELLAIWKDGKYYFDQETFSSIAIKLERRFNIKVKIKSDKLKKEFFTGLFDKSKSIYQILDAMKSYRDFNYTTIKDSIVITGKR